MDDLTTLHPSFADDVSDVWSYEHSVESRNSAGGTAKASVLAQIGAVKEKASNMRARSIGL